MSTAVQVEHRSDVAEARRRAISLGTDSGLSQEAVGRVALVATELATNLVKHARGGWFYASRAPDLTGAVDLLVVDRGPGIEDLPRALNDGYSTSGTPGTGIGAARRQSVTFDLLTHVDRGTVVMARAGPDPNRAPGPEARSVSVRGFAAPRPGETVCGDEWATRTIGAETYLLVADGLGHGPAAAEASAAARSVFLESRATETAAMVEEIHAALGATRGAAVAVTRIAPACSGVRFAGIGNISGKIVAGTGSRGMVSSNGTAGYVARSVREYEYEAPPGSFVVLHSDGVSARWNLDAYPGLWSRDPALLVGLLLRDFGRGRDDASVVVARLPEPDG